MFVLGEYKEIYGDGSLPSIHDYVSLEKQENKDKIIEYLKRGKVKACAAGKAVDVFTGEIISSELSYMTDGHYEWRSDLIYYIEKYNLILEQDFIQRVTTELSSFVPSQS